MIDTRSCFQCKWLGNDRMNLGPCNRCVDHSLYEPINKEENNNVLKSCFQCRYLDSSPGDEMCRSCLNHSNFRKKREEMDNKEQKDNINPDHYKSETSLECIEAMEIIFGRDAVIDFCVCNAWKYIWRWKHKNGKEDLRKSAWYLTHAFDMMSSDDKNFDTVRGMINYVGRQGISVKKERDDG